MIPNNGQEDMMSEQQQQGGEETKSLQFDPQQYPDLQAFEPGDEIQLMIVGKVGEGEDGLLSVVPDQVVVKGNAAAQQVKKMQRMGNEGSSRKSSLSGESSTDY